MNKKLAWLVIKIRSWDYTRALEFRLNLKWKLQVNTNVHRVRQEEFVTLLDQVNKPKSKTAADLVPRKPEIEGMHRRILTIIGISAR